jgi:predicted nucleotidyltransferase
MEKARTLPDNLRRLLDRLGDGLAELYGSRYRGLVLHGSYARGDAGERSDVDLLLLLDGTVDVMQEMDRAQDVKWPLALEAGYTVSLIPVTVDDYLRSHEPYLWNARKEGFSVS